jgi:hypothetical protein
MEKIEERAVFMNRLAQFLVEETKKSNNNHHLEMGKVMGSLAKK